MGLCTSTVHLPLTREEVKARRAELIRFRKKYESYAERIAPPPNVNFTVEIEPGVAAPEGTRGVDDALATFQRGSHTSTREINFALSGMMSVDNNYDYGKSVVLSLKDKKTKDVISAALMCEVRVVLCARERTPLEEDPLTQPLSHRRSTTPVEERFWSSSGS